MVGVASTRPAVQRSVGGGGGGGGGGGSQAVAPPGTGRARSTTSNSLRAVDQSTTSSSAGKPGELPGDPTRNGVPKTCATQHDR